MHYTLMNCYGMPDGILSSFIVTKSSELCLKENQRLHRATLALKIYGLSAFFSLVDVIDCKAEDLTILSQKKMSTCHAAIISRPTCPTANLLF